MAHPARVQTDKEGCKHAKSGHIILCPLLSYRQHRDAFEACGRCTFASTSWPNSSTVDTVTSHRDCKCLGSMALAADVAAHSTDSPFYSVSLQTTASSVVRIHLFVFGLLLTILFGRTRMHHSAYYSVRI